MNADRHHQYLDAMTQFTKKSAADVQFLQVDVILLFKTIHIDKAEKNENNISWGFVKHH